MKKRNRFPSLSSAASPLEARMLLQNATPAPQFRVALYEDVTRDANNNTSYSHNFLNVANTNYTSLGTYNNKTSGLVLENTGSRPIVFGFYGGSNYSGASLYFVVKGYDRLTVNLSDYGWDDRIDSYQVKTREYDPRISWVWEQRTALKPWQVQRTGSTNSFHLKTPQQFEDLYSGIAWQDDPNVPYDDNGYWNRVTDDQLRRNGYL